MAGESELLRVAARTLGPADASSCAAYSPGVPQHQLAELRAELASRRETLGLSFAALAAAVDRPASTVHGWLAGTHVPYPRDRETFERVLEVLEVDNPREISVQLSRARHAPSSETDRGDLLARLEQLERRVEDLESERNKSVGGARGGR